jgi:hypothetical protein
MPASDLRICRIISFVPLWGQVPLFSHFVGERMEPERLSGLCQVAKI